MELQEKLSIFGYYNENDFYCNSQSFRVCPEVPFNWNLLLIGILSAKGIWKNVPILQVGGHALAPPTWPVLRVVLLQSEGPRKDLWNPTVYTYNTYISQNCLSISTTSSFQSHSWLKSISNLINHLLYRERGGFTFQNLTR